MTNTSTNVAVRSLKTAPGKTADIARLCLRKAGVTGFEIQATVDAAKRPSRYSLSRMAARYGFGFETTVNAKDGLMRYHFIRPAKAARKSA